ncbi:lymphocyte function-associated antigen 3 isoform X3 [Cuculus canorus]|uniref:lymphocyte function-associated antigen 3 isoform X3 n=1 Tax=Cuculus canorus TaxID=55661 RepID=UPI0023AA96FA|nr:lymphocyte function-associated antigen 3 isoform X3 [Cuculus canorus]
MWRLLCLLPLLAHIHCDEVFGIVGENFTFPVKSGQNITEILWTKNKNKVAEWEGQNETTYYTSLIDRGLLNKKNGYLTIYNLENSDAGTYELTYLDFVKENYAFTFMLSVLPPPSEPEITCNISGDDFVLNCIADFPKPLDYSWKLDSTLVTHHTTEIVIPNKNVDVSKKAVCLIKFSQTERSSEISLSKCFPDEKGDSYQKRNRDALWGASVFFLLPVGITIFLYIKGILFVLVQLEVNLKREELLRRVQCITQENTRHFILWRTKSSFIWTELHLHKLLIMRMKSLKQILNHNQITTLWIK